MSGAPSPPSLPDPNSGPRSFTTTDKDHGGIALTICTLMATWVVLCYGIRVFMRLTVSGPFGVDDILCSIATVFGVVQMAVFSTAISFGFGKALELLTDDQIRQASKAIYAAQLLYIITNALSKCTVALLLARIVFIKSRVYACYAVLAISCLWGFASFLAEAIRCTGHAPWNITSGNSCGNNLLAWKVITAFNVVIEALLFALPVWLVWNLKTSLSKKLTVVAVFGLRLPVIAAAILRVHYLADAIESTEPLLKGVIPFICMNIEMHYGIMASTFPTLKPFIKSFNTAWGTHDTHGVGGYGQHSRESHALESLEKNGSRKASKQRSPEGSKGSYGKNVTLVSTPPMPTVSASSDSRDSESSQRQMIIHQTRTCEIFHEDK